MGAAYYNEIDPAAAQWLRNLIKAGHIAPGVVDTRSIEDVYPAELREFTQCHFFAGIGIWSHALRQAGWGDDRPVWTGSCPCQPFSAAGKGGGFTDERHLWPAFNHLIQECKPAIVFGEQVASKAVEPWIDLVHADLEALGYAFGCVPFPSAGVGAPHIRDRAYWVANSNYPRLEGREAVRQRANQCATGPDGVAGGLGNANGESTGWNAGSTHAAEAGYGAQGGNCDGPWDASNGIHRLADTNDHRCSPVPEPGLHNTEHHTQSCSSLDRTGPTNGFWRNADWLGCRDGKWRPVEPGLKPLVNGSASGVGRMRTDQERIASLPRKDQGSRIVRLKGYGNAINAKAAQAFIESVMVVA